MTREELIQQLKDIRAVLSDTEEAPFCAMSLEEYNRYCEYLNSSQNFILAIKETHNKITNLIVQLEKS